MISAVSSQLILKTCYFLELKKNVPKKKKKKTSPLADSSNDCIIQKRRTEQVNCNVLLRLSLLKNI